MARGKVLSAESVRAHGAVTVADTAVRFPTEYVEPDRSPSTLRSYRQAIDSYIRPWLGATGL